MVYFARFVSAIGASLSFDIIAAPPLSGPRYVALARLGCEIHVEVAGINSEEYHGECNVGGPRRK